ncbi:MAG TPA: copper resistance protein CopC [Chloroflexia bacterium]|nr:copper resistance protein CopC [Chloroflexia bacterium]
MYKKRALILLLLFLTALSFQLNSPGTVSAHAELVRTEPADGATLSQAPAQLRLWFNDPIVMDFIKVELTDGDGQKLAVPAARLDPAGAGNPLYGPKSVLVVVDLPELDPNAYRVNWQVRSADDLHVINGVTVFGLQRTVAKSATTDTSAVTRPAEVTMRWVYLVGLGSLLAALAFLLGLFPDQQTAENRVLRQRTINFALLANGVACLGGFGLLLEQGWDDASWWTILSRTDYGTRWWVGQLLLVALLGVLWLVRSGQKAAGDKPVYRGLRLAVLLSIVHTAVQSTGNHSGGSAGPGPLSVAVDTIHLLAASLWSGGLLALVVMVVPLMKRGPSESALAAAILRRFGWLALVCVLALIVTGLLKTADQVASLDALLTTLYGQALMLKIELFLLVGLVGLLNAAILHPRVAEALGRILRRKPGWKPFGAGRLKRLLLVECAGGVAVLLLAGVLSASQPARGPEFDPPLAEENAPVQGYSATSADLVFNMTVRPNRPGQNFLDVDVLNTRRPAPGKVESVTVRLVSKSDPSKEITLQAEALDNNRYQVAGGYFNAAGDWDVSVVANRPGLKEAGFSTTWKVLPEQAFGSRRPVMISNEPLRPFLLAAAALVILVACAFSVLWWRRRKPATRAPKVKLFWPGPATLSKEGNKEP